MGTKIETSTIVGRRVKWYADSTWPGTVVDVVESDKDGRPVLLSVMWDGDDTAERVYYSDVTL